MVSVAGHFPNSSDADFQQYLVLGPMTRFAVDLAQLLELMAGPEAAAQLRLHELLPLSQLQVHYALGFEGLNGGMHQAVEEDIQTAIRKAVVHLQTLGLPVQRAKLTGFGDSLEIALSGIARLVQMPFVLDSECSQVGQTVMQLLRSLCGKSRHTTNALIFDLMRRTNAFMPSQRLESYRREAQTLAGQLTVGISN